MADLTKMVREWIKADVERRFQIENQTVLYNLLEAMAAEIKANREEIGRLIVILEKTLPAINEHMRITKEEIEKLKAERKDR